MTTPEIVGLTAKAISDNAKRLGLQWTMRPLTVDSYDATTGVALATFDGDTKSISMTSLTGFLLDGQRAMGMVVPPSGNFIIGPTGSSTSTAGQVVAYAVSTSSAGAVTAETISLTAVSTVPLVFDRAYEVQTVVNLVDGPTPAANTMGQVRVRENSLGGSIILDTRSPLVLITGFFITTFFANQFRVGTSGIKTLLSTLQSNTATAITDLASPTALRWLKIVDIGPADDFGTNFLSLPVIS